MVIEIAGMWGNFKTVNIIFYAKNQVFFSFLTGDEAKASQETPVMFTVARTMR